MDRKTFLKGLGITSVGMSLPWAGREGNEVNSALTPVDDCVLIPTETAGPFPLDLTENTEFFRQDVREDEAGVQLNLKMRIVGLDNCGPMQNVRVNIWHCNKDGWYSGYDGNNNPGQEGLTYCRGYQLTDANGEVDFITILPGWYTGRICHIHFQVWVSSSYAAISQLTFPLEPKNAIYEANSDIYTKGLDPLNFSQDNVFADGHEYQLATLTQSSEAGVYESFMEVTVEGSGTTATGHIEKETAKVMSLGQNYPNPYTDQTTIPFELFEAADVKLEIWGLNGMRLRTILDERMSPGKRTVWVDLQNLGLPKGNYIYQLEARSANGIFRIPKVMTVMR